jgi:hypothetical protein
MRILSRLALFLLVAGALATSPPAEGVMYGIYCPSGTFFYTTPQNWGKGATCADAWADLRARAEADIFCPDYGDCQKQLITAPCFQISSNPDMFQVDGHYKYKCKICPTCP